MLQRKEDLMHFICRQCGIRLSEEVRLAELRERNERDGESYLPQGTTIQEDDSFFHQNVGSYIVNVNDVVHTTHTNCLRRLAGCCGLDGMDGPNLICVQCGVEVATKKTDCWMPHCVIFERRSTRTRKSFDENRARFYPQGRIRIGNDRRSCVD